MIYLLLGRPGGGKSYEATVFHVLPALMAGRKVITNLPLNVEAFRAIVPNLDGLLHIRTKSVSLDTDIRVFASPDDYGDEWRHPESGAGPLYVIDECHKAIPKIGTSRAVQEWFAEHRHETADVLLITQSYSKIDRAIVEMVDVCYQVQKATALGDSSRYVRKVKWGVRGETVNTAIRKYEPRYFSLYQSHTRGGGAELQAQDIRSIWRHWSIQGAALCIVFAIGWMAWFGLDFFPEPAAASQVVTNPDGAAVVRKTVVHTTPAVTPVSPSAPAVARAAPEREADKGPFDGLGLHIFGYLATADRWTYGIALSQNGVVIRMTDSNELVQVGYQVERVGECAARARYGDRSIWIRCDAPAAVATPFGGSVGTKEPQEAGEAAGGSPPSGGEAPSA